MLIEVHVITAFSGPRNPIRKLILIENGRNQLYYWQLEQSLDQLGCRRTQVIIPALRGFAVK
jgi:hypothetical protein